MTVQDLKGLFDYGCWANDRLCGVLSQLTTDQFTQSVAGSYGSIRNPMVHMLSAEWGWLERCGGTARGPALNAQDYPTVASLFDRWKYVEARVREFPVDCAGRRSRACGGVCHRRRRKASDNAHP